MSNEEKMLDVGQVVSAMRWSQLKANLEQLRSAAEIAQDEVAILESKVFLGLAEMDSLATSKIRLQEQLDFLHALETVSAHAGFNFSPDTSMSMESIAAKDVRLSRFVTRVNSKGLTGLDSE